MQELNQSFVLYTNYSEILTMLSDEDLGKIFRAILIYKKNKEVIELPNQLAVIFALVKNQLDLDELKYNEKCQKNSNNGKKGGAPVGNSNAEKTTQNNPKQPKTTQAENKTTQNNPKQPKTTQAENKTTQNKHNENENENENENVFKEEEVEEEKKQVFEKTAATAAKDELNNCFYGEYCNVYLDKQDYNKILAICQDKKYLSRLIDELSEKVETGKYPIYDEKRPHAHLALLVKFHQMAKTNPKKFRVLTAGASTKGELCLKDIVEKKIKEMEMERKNE